MPFVAAFARTRGNAVCSRRLLVDHRLGQFGQLLVRRLFLFQRRLHQVGDVAQAELLRPGPDAAVAGHLVVLDLLGGGDQAGVEDLGLGLGVDEFLTLLGDALETLAGLLLGAGAELLEGLLQPRHLVLGLLEVLGEALAQLLVAGRLDHLGQGLEDLMLGPIQVLQLVDQQLLHRLDLHRRVSFRHVLPRTPNRWATFPSQRQTLCRHDRGPSSFFSRRPAGYGSVAP